MESAFYGPLGARTVPESQRWFATPDRLPHYAERIGAKVIIRSLRAVTDFDYELQMAAMNKQMRPNVETVFLFANPKLFFSASRLIKEVASYGQRVPELVPEFVMNRLRAKLKVD